MDHTELRPLLPDIDPFGFADVMREIGNALWRVQQLEEAVQVYLVMLHGFDNAVAADVAESFLEKNKRQTLGRLVRDVNKSQRVPEELSERLDAFVGPRNWLVHHSQSESRRALTTREGRASISAKIDALTEEASVLQRMIAEDVEAELRRRGFTERTLLQNAKAELRARYGA